MYYAILLKYALCYLFKIVLEDWLQTADLYEASQKELTLLLHRLPVPELAFVYENHCMMFYRTRGFNKAGSW